MPDRMSRHQRAIRAPGIPPVVFRGAGTATLAFLAFVGFRRRKKPRSKPTKAKVGLAKTHGKARQSQRKPRKAKVFANAAPGAPLRLQHLVQMLEQRVEARERRRRERAR